LSPSKRLDNLNKINEIYSQEFQKSKNIKIGNIDKVNLDSFCLNVNSEELESLKDIIFQDKKERLKKLIWMYSQEKNENEKILAIQNYVDKYLKLPIDVDNLFNLERKKL
jgi:hypothetical protein